MKAGQALYQLSYTAQVNGKQDLPFMLNRKRIITTPVLQISWTLWLSESKVLATLSVN